MSTCKTIMCWQLIYDEMQNNHVDMQLNILLDVDIIMLHVDINKSHVNIIMLHVDINKSHVIIIMLHEDII